MSEVLESHNGVPTSVQLHVITPIQNCGPFVFSWPFNFFPAAGGELWPLSDHNLPLRHIYIKGYLTRDDGASGPSPVPEVCRIPNCKHDRFFIYIARCDSLLQFIIKIVLSFYVFCFDDGGWSFEGGFRGKSGYSEQWNVGWLVLAWFFLFFYFCFGSGWIFNKVVPILKSFGFLGSPLSFINGRVGGSRDGDYLSPKLKVKLLNV